MLKIEIRIWVGALLIAPFCWLSNDVLYVELRQTVSGETLHKHILKVLLNYMDDKSKLAHYVVLRS